MPPKKHIVLGKLEQISTNQTKGHVDLPSGDIQGHFLEVFLWPQNHSLNSNTPTSGMTGWTDLDSSHTSSFHLVGSMVYLPTCRWTSMAKSGSNIPGSSFCVQHFCRNSSTNPIYQKAFCFYISGRSRYKSWGCLEQCSILFYDVFFHCL